MNSKTNNTITTGNKNAWYLRFFTTAPIASSATITDEVMMSTTKPLVSTSPGSSARSMS